MSMLQASNHSINNNNYNMANPHQLIFSQIHALLFDPSLSSSRRAELQSQLEFLETAEKIILHFYGIFSVGRNSTTSSSLLPPSPPSLDFPAFFFSLKILSLNIASLESSITATGKGQHQENLANLRFQILKIQQLLKNSLEILILASSFPSSSPSTINVPPKYVLEKWSCTAAEYIEAFWASPSAKSASGNDNENIGWRDFDGFFRTIYLASPNDDPLFIGQRTVSMFYISLSQDIFKGFNSRLSVTRKSDLSTCLMACALDHGILREWIQSIEVNVATSVSSVGIRGDDNPVLATMAGRTNIDLLAELVGGGQHQGENADGMGWLIRFMRGLEVIVSSIVSSSGQNLQAKTDAVLLHLQVIDSLLVWVPVKAIYGSKILEFLLQLLLLSSTNSASFSLNLQSALLDAMLTLFCRNFGSSTEHNQIRQSLFWDNLFSRGLVHSVLFTYICRLHGLETYTFTENNTSSTLIPIFASFEPSPQISDVDTFLQCMEKAGEICSALATQHVSYKKNTEALPHTFLSHFIPFMMSLSRHRWNIMSTLALDCIIDLFRHDYTRTQMIIGPSSPLYQQQPDDSRYLLSILDSILSGLCADTSNFYFVENTTKKDMALGVAHVTSRRLEFLKIVSLQLKQPRIIFGWIASRVGEFYSQAQSDDQVGVGVAAALDCIMSSIPGTHLRGAAKNDLLIEDVGNLLQALLGVVPAATSTCQVTTHLSMLSAFSQVMDLYPANLFTCMERFFALSAHVLPGIEDNSIQEGRILSEDTMTIRRKGQQALVRLGGTMPDIFAPILDQLVPPLLTIVSSRRLIKIEERYIIEFLVLIISGAKILDPQTKMSWLSRILAREFEVLSSYQSMFDGSVPGSFYGILVPQPYASWSSSQRGELSPEVLLQFNNLQKYRQDFSNILLSFRNWMRKSLDIAKKYSVGEVGFLWAPYVPVIFSLSLQVTKQIHSLWNPETWKYLPPQLKKITTLTPFEKVIALGIDQDEVASQKKSVTQTPLDLQIYNVWSWLGRVREACYQVFATLPFFSMEFYKSPLMPATFLECLFADVESVSVLHWKSIIVLVVTPLIIHCPVELFNSVLGIAIPTLTTFLNKQVVKAWEGDLSTRVTAQEDEEIDEEDSANVSDEVIQEKLVRTFTRSYAEMWHTIFSPPVLEASVRQPQNPSGGSPSSLKQQQVALVPPPIPFRYPNLVQYCFSNTSLLQGWTDSFLLLLSLKDTSSCHSVLAILPVLIQPFLSDTSTHSFLGSSLLTAVLGVLADGYQKANHGEAIHVIIEIYVKMRPVSMEPYNTLSTLEGMQPDVLNKFEADLMKEPTLKVRTTIAKSFFAKFHGLEMSEWGGKESVRGKGESGGGGKSALFTKNQKHVGRTSILEGQDETSVVGDLFG